jgi:nucleotide-binding universal stress UspA family protein
MYKKMLVLLDGSPLSEVVFYYAQELSGRLKIDLELLHVCNPQEAEQLPMRQAYMEHKAEELQKKAEEIYTKTGGTPDQAIKAKAKVIVGYPAEEILKYVDINSIDLVMLSTHGRSGIRSWDLGSVAHKVIHAAVVPVWLVPAELRQDIILDKTPKRTMVVPLDGSKMSEGIIPHALNIAKQRGAESEIVLVHVENIRGPDSINPEFSNKEQFREKEAEHLAMQRYLDQKVKLIQEKGIMARAEILRGETAPAILDFVKKNPTQLIAMATHAHAGLSRMIFGSVTENILHLVKKTPIFLFKPKE